MTVQPGKDAMRDLKPPQQAAALAAALSLLLLLPAELSAQNQPVPCPTGAGKAQPATPPDRASADGTAPGNAGSTGWTGGTGGAHIGTSPHGATEHSKTWQPPTARGLDLAMEVPPESAKDPPNNGC
jgi:hypothetical protein